MIDAMSPPVRIASSVVLAAAAVAAGYGLGLKIAGTRNAAVAGAAVLGLAGGALVYKMNAEVPEVAAITLHNLVLGHDDPLELKREEVEGVAKRFEFIRK
jgi:Chloroplast envelope transporter